jgi:bifunctional DNase/RNase
MIEVTIDSVRVSLLSQHRVVILKDINEEHYLPIWIGPCEADAITIQLQGIEVARPQTHDLLKSVLDVMGAQVHHILVNDLRNDTFYAHIVVDSNGRRLEIDSRPSDAIALAVRVGSPIFVAESVMDQAAITPEEGSEEKEDEEDNLTVFRDFVDTLDLGTLPKD